MEFGMMMHNPYGGPEHGAPPVGPPPPPPPPQQHHHLGGPPHHHMGPPPPPQHVMMHPHPACEMGHPHLAYGPPQPHYGGVFALVDQLGEVEHHLPPPPPPPLAPSGPQHQLMDHAGAIQRGGRRGVKRNPEAPKRPMSPYVTFVKAKWSETYERMGPSAAAKDVMRALGNVWNSMSEQDKEEWKNLSDADKARYADEMKSFDGPVTVPHDRRKKNVKKRSKKDPNAPKRGASAFLLFANDKRQTLRDANPDKHNVDISKMLGAIWKNATDDDKKPYIDAESEARKRYEREMQEYRKAQDDSPHHDDDSDAAAPPPPHGAAEPPTRVGPVVVGGPSLAVAHSIVAPHNDHAPEALHMPPHHYVLPPH